MLSNLGADYQDSQLTKKQTEISEADRKALSDWIGARPEAKQVTEPLGPNDITGSFGSGDSNKDPKAIQAAISDIKDPFERANAQKAFDQQLAGVTTKTTTVQPTRSELLNWAAQGQKGGVLTRALSGKTLEDLTVNAQKREEDRLTREHEKAIALIAARQRQTEADNLKRELEISRSSDRRYSADTYAQSRRDVADMVQSGKVQPKDTLTPFGEDDQGRTLYARNGNENDVVTGGYKHAEGSQKPAPVPLLTAYAKNNTAIQNMDRDFAAVNAPGAKDATGLLKGAIPSKFANRIWSKEEEVAARIAVANILNTRVHDLSGAATSVQELFRLSQNLPTASDTMQELQIKIPKLRAELVAHNKALDALNTSQGYKSLSGNAAPPPKRAALPQRAELARRAEPPVQPRPALSRCHRHSRLRPRPRARRRRPR